MENNVLLSTVYGPVPSWRFGRSLGVDVVLPPKKCTFNCIYCQLGRTRRHVAGPEELGEAPVDVERVVDDLDRVMKRLDMTTIDVVTFSGTGEPTLNLRLGEIAKEVKKKVGSLPLIILTNSSLFHRKDVRKNLSRFDLVVAKLDAGDDETFRLINRPADENLKIETILDSIKKLRKEIKGALALEVMLLRSEDGRITNVDGRPLRNLTNAILSLEPDHVQLEVPYRPPSESFVKPPPQEKIKLIFNELSGILSEERLLVYGLHDKRGRRVTWLSHEALEREIAELLERRPCRSTEISTSLGIDPSATKKLLQAMTRKGILTVKVMDGEEYYSCEREP